SPSSMKTEMNMVDEVDAFIKVPQGWPIANSALKLLYLKGFTSIFRGGELARVGAGGMLTGCSMKGRNEAQLFMPTLF
ncbi:hypothetical protein Tco_0188400, partial [Tanacetum coccineum]